jgi:hypothetical protein
METGTGIFLAGLVIGLVMLYGQTKDRWDWQKITKYAGITIGVIIFIPAIYLYHESNNWKAFEYDMSFRGVVIGLLTIIALMVTAASPVIALSIFYEKVLGKSFEYDENGIDRPAYKFLTYAFGISFYVLTFFYYDYFKEGIGFWLAPVFK